MTQPKIIADRATAERIGHRFVETNPSAASSRPFQYQQPRSGLTLFGALIVMKDGSEHEIRFQ